MVFVNTTVIQVVSIVVTSLIGMFGLSMALEGYLSTPLSLPLRILTAIGGLMLIYPGIATDLIGVVVVGGVILLQRLAAKKAAAA